MFSPPFGRSLRDARVYFPLHPFVHDDKVGAYLIESGDSNFVNQVYIMSNGSTYSSGGVGVSSVGQTTREKRNDQLRVGFAATG